MIESVKTERREDDTGVVWWETTISTSTQEEAQEAFNVFESKMKKPILNLQLEQNDITTTWKH